MAESAGLIATLDLVISVDTSIAHLAGAMGAAVWVALPRLADWRWMDEREDSPWYPTARLFRQKSSGDWRAPVERMREELQSIVVARARKHGDKPVAGWSSAASACGWAGSREDAVYVTGCGAGIGPG